METTKISFQKPESYEGDNLFKVPPAMAGFVLPSSRRNPLKLNRLVLEWGRTIWSRVWGHGYLPEVSVDGRAAI